MQINQPQIFLFSNFSSLFCSDSPKKTQPEEVFTDVFESIQMHLDMIEGLRVKPWTMDKKLDILR